MSLSSPLQRSAHLLRQRSRSPLCLLSSRLPVVGHPVYGFALLSVLFNTVSSLRARGTDSPPAPLIRSTSLGTFAHYTLTERMPAVARRIVKDGLYKDSAAEDRLHSLIDEIPHQIVNTSFLESGAGLDAREVEEWRRFIDTKGTLSDGSPKPWMEVAPGILAEMLFYRRVLSATGYFGELGKVWQGVDPYTVQKEAALNRTLSRVEALCGAVADAQQMDDVDLLHVLSTSALWANRDDLSLNPMDDENSDSTSRASKDGISRMLVAMEGLKEQSSYVLSDGARDAWQHVLRSDHAQVHYVTDNAGFELLSDLVLMDALLSRKIAKSVTVHLKAFPTFVSDCTEKDFLEHIRFMHRHPSADVRKLALSLSHHVENRSLLLRSDPFWMYPRLFDDMPSSLSSLLANAALVIVKGDANYRRLMLDRQWPFTYPFSDVVSYFPAPVLALRTCKAETACGLTDEAVSRASAADAKWLVNGRWGVLHFADVGLLNHERSPKDEL